MAIIRSYKHSYSKPNITNIFITKDAYSYQCMTYLYLSCSNSGPIASMHGHVNEWRDIKRLYWSIKNIKNILFDQTHSCSSSNHIIKQYACTCECMTYLTYLATTQHLWHQCMDMWINDMALKLRDKKINLNLNMLKTNKHLNKENRNL